MKIIIWGYPLYSHTQSYIHEGWFKAFKYLGLETFWFHDQEYPSDFDFNDCLFITEGFCCDNIPIIKNNTYFINNAIHPERYLDREARLIDIRFNVDHINDCNYQMRVDKNKLVKLGPCFYYEPKANNSVLSNQYRNSFIDNYEAIYISWATDLLPHEFNFDDRFISREDKVYYIGTIGSGNSKEIQKALKALNNLNIPVLHIDPWVNPCSTEQQKKYVQHSKISFDLRGSLNGPQINNGLNTGCNHKLIGYIPCRVFKNISYGRLTGTNSRHVKDLLGDYVVYNDDEEQLIIDLVKKENQNNDDLILQSMRHIQDNHTYLQRAKNILEVYNNG